MGRLEESATTNTLKIILLPANATNIHLSIFKDDEPSTISVAPDIFLPNVNDFNHSKTASISTDSAWIDADTGIYKSFIIKSDQSDEYECDDYDADEESEYSFSQTNNQKRLMLTPVPSITEISDSSGCSISDFSMSEDGDDMVNSNDLH